MASQCWPSPATRWAAWAAARGAAWLSVAWREREETCQGRAHSAAAVGRPLCLQFGAQEPGSHAEIEAFVAAKFGAQFPLMSKVQREEAV